MADRLAIRELLDHDPISFAIVTYLSHHPQAMDTAPGAAEWWIHQELGPTQEALTKLVDLGVVHCRSNGTSSLYAYARDPKLHGWLVRYLNQGDGRPRSFLLR